MSIRRSALLLAVLVGLAQTPAAAQGITIPNTFTNGTVADATQVNANFAALAANALNRNGGTLGGTLNLNGQTLSGTATVSGAWSFSAVATFSAGSAAAPGATVGTAGNGLYASGTNALDLTTAGIKAFGITSSQALNSPTQPRVRAYKNAAAQSIADSTPTAITLDGESLDVGAMHDLVTNNSRLTVPAGGDGLYLVTGSVAFAASAVGLRLVAIYKNGAEIQETALSASAAATQVIPVSVLAVLAAGDYVETYAYQASGGPLNVNNGASTTQLSAVKLW